MRTALSTSTAAPALGVPVCKERRCARLSTGLASRQPPFPFITEISVLWLLTIKSRFLMRTRAEHCRRGKVLRHF